MKGPFDSADDDESSIDKGEMRSLGAELEGVGWKPRDRNVRLRPGTVGPSLKVVASSKRPKLPKAPVNPGNSKDEVS